MSSLSEVMERGRLIRANSALVLNRSAITDFRPPRRSASLTRVSAYRPSAVDVSLDLWMTEKYRPRRYRRDWDLFDDYWHDRYYYMSPYNWTTYRFSRRNAYLDPVYTPNYWYSGSWGWGTRYRYSTGSYLDPHRLRDPLYDRPLWLQPSVWERRTSNFYNDLYIPTRVHGSRRYYYSYA